MPYPEPNKICRVYLVDGAIVRADGLPLDIWHIYIQQDRENPIEGEAWLYDGPFPDSMVSPEPPPDA